MKKFKICSVRLCLLLILSSWIPTFGSGYIFMERIPLTRGHFALVDDDDYEHLIKFTWNAQNIHNHWYGYRSVWTPTRKGIAMHRQIMNIWDPKILVDHIDRNGLNNQKVNLRLCTTAQNCANKQSVRGSSSKYLGVCWVSDRKRWCASIKKGNKTKFLGHYFDETEAAIAYNDAAKKLHGEFANLNVV